MIFYYVWSGAYKRYNMEQIIRKKLGTFDIYTKEEADALGLEYKYWKESDKGGWCISDDGWVCKVLSLQEYTSKSGRKVRYYGFPYGRYWTSSNSKCLYELRKQFPGSYNRTKAQTWGSHILKKRVIKNLIKDVLQMRLVGWRDRKIAGELGKKYFPKDPKSWIAVKKVMNNVEVRKIMEEEFDKALEKHGITTDLLITKWLKAVEIAETNEDADIILKAIKMVSDWKGLGQKKQVTEQIGMVTTEYLEGKIDREEKLLAGRSEITN